MADPVTWSSLSKSVADLTTIVEQIAADILAHNLDPSAHGQSGEGIYTHRIASILDHADGSISFKKFLYDNILISTAFSSLDGWEQIPGAGAISCRIMGSCIRTGATLNDEAELYIDSDNLDIVLDPTKNPFFQTTVQMGSDEDVVAYIVCGDKEGGGSNDSFGFKIVDDALYAYWTKGGVVNTQAIAGITLTDFNVYRAWIDSTAEEIYFYVNGTLEYTATANFPTDTTIQFFGYYIKTTKNLWNKSMYPIDFYFEQDR